MMRWLAGMLVLALGLGLPCSGAFPAPPGPLEDWKFVEDYFNRFFLWSKKTPISSLEERMRFLQRFFHLSVTGRLDAETLGLLKQPRCGVPDVAEYRYFPGSPRWNKKLLTYRILNYPPGLSKTTVGAAVDQALRVWSDVTPLMFRRLEGQGADMDIAFRIGDHGDGFSFDGPGNILAHAFAPGPEIGGDVHFDREETWSTTELGINLFLVATHELGHALGLAHSGDPDSIMFPHYRYVDPGAFRLSLDDVRGIQRLYGRRKNF
ncbi:matrilysin-like [Tachyglossus aculeatus]|uniref:matrilysin-like n=1 Tax=Tachyglossus aculeatus TaxID=9261 RepID=UPI0018F63DF2|nr:matrilysin-like [Tachyglossus aculeatus]